MGEIKPVENEKIKLWNKNFFLLWQGQLVSVLGDVIYTIALDFWILDVTGSTAIMGLLSALTMLPRLILGPFAGVFVDRWDRKRIIVITDFIRGVFVTFVGIAALMGFIKVWMVFIVGIVNGLCSAFFNPTVMAVKPDIVHESKLVQANSATSLAQSGMDMVGNAVGGIIYVAIGAPYMFLFNGISYIFSSFTELFIDVPKLIKKKNKVSFKEDFKEGFKFIWNFKTLRDVFLCVCCINFFFNAGMILFIPYFKENKFLGIEKYGYTMTIMAMGMVLGSILLSVFKLKKKHKFYIYKYSLTLWAVEIVLFPLIKNYNIIVFIMFTAALCIAVFNNIFNSTMILVIPKDKRGKVSAIASTLSMGLMPLGSLVGGFLGEIMKIKYALLVLYVMGLVVSIMCVSVKGSKNIIEFEGKENDIKNLINNTNNLYDM